MQREALEHKPTTRPCVVLPPATLSEAAPYIEPGTRYVLVLATENAEATFSLPQARAWLDAGASYVCASGPGASAMEESFDYASFLPEVGAPLPFTLMTTSHEKQTFEEALWFAFWCSAPPDDLPEDLSLVVVQPSSASLFMRARSWVQSNLE
jgi:hypothetical protein